MDGELRSENLYLPPMLEQRSVVAAVMIALDLKIETVLEGVVVGKLRIIIRTCIIGIERSKDSCGNSIHLSYSLNLITLPGWAVTWRRGFVNVNYFL